MREDKTGTRGRNLEAGTNAEAMKDLLSLACSACLLRQPRATLLRGGVTHSELDPPMSVIRCPMDMPTGPFDGGKSSVKTPSSLDPLYKNQGRATGEVAENTRFRASLGDRPSRSRGHPPLRGFTSVTRVPIIARVPWNLLSGPLPQPRAPPHLLSSFLLHGAATIIRLCAFHAQAFTSTSCEASSGTLSSVSAHVPCPKASHTP